MERRKFLGLGMLAGLVAGVSPTARRLVDAQPMPRNTATEPYAGRFFIFVNAGGGWDPTMVCDPKGGDINHQFMPSAIASSGPFQYAPISFMDGARSLSNREFFDKFRDRLLVLNGIDMQTNNHDTGTRYTWSGHLEDGYPPLAAIIAAALAPGRPLAFLSNGGYENTVGVAPLTRLNSIDTIARIARPNLPDPNNPGVSYFSATTAERIHRAQAQRLGAMAAAQTLPAYQLSMRQLLETRGGSNLFERMMMFLPSNDVLNRATNPILKQGMVALAAYRAGISAAANLSVGGFDTHGNHDASQGTAIGRLLSGVDLLMDYIDSLSLRDQVVVMVGSDFGRTPQYNAQMGKDHWSVTSMMMMGAGIRGGRVVGATDDRFRARGLDFASLTPSDTAPRKLNPKSIHMALRHLAGVDTSDVARQFPIYGDSISLFE
ncbi:MAG: DUF1501 domain-containing protein [Polyangiales bacterium]